QVSVAGAGKQLTAAATGLASAVSSSFNVNSATLIGRADNKGRAYGDSNPVFTASYSGFVNGEDASLVGGTLTASTTAQSNSPVGAYPITVSGQSAPNYTIQYMDGTLTVTAAALVVMADNASRAYGHTNPAFTATISG